MTDNTIAVDGNGTATDLTTLAADNNITVNPDLTDAEEKELEALLNSLFGMVPSAPDADYLDSGAPTTEEYPTQLRTGKVVANDSRVLVVLGTEDRAELVYDFRLVDGKIVAHRADAAPAPAPRVVEPPTFREFPNAKLASVMFDNEVFSLVIEDQDGTAHGIGLKADDGGTISAPINYTRNTDNTITSHPGSII